MISPISAFDLNGSIHFSVDDVFSSFVRAAESNTALLDQPLFSFLKRLHESYGASTDLYVFLEGAGGSRKLSLSSLPNRIFNELSSQTWIRLGPHARSYGDRPYLAEQSQNKEFISAILQQIDRVDRVNSKSEVVRFHYFSELIDISPFLIASGVKGIFFTDKAMSSYHLPENEIRDLRDNGYVVFGDLYCIASMIRAENFLRRGGKYQIRRKAAQCLENFGFVTLFTHECELVNPDLQDLIIDVFEEIVAIRSG